MAFNVMLTLRSMKDLNDLYYELLMNMMEVDALVSIFQQLQVKCQSDEEWSALPSPSQPDVQLDYDEEWPALPSPRQPKRKNTESKLSKPAKCRRKLFNFL